jgi:uncharacterized membrane protein
MAIAGLILSALAGALLGNRFEAMIEGALVGVVTGIVFGEWRKAQRRRAALDAHTIVDTRVDDRMRAMEQRIADLERAVRALAPEQAGTDKVGSGTTFRLPASTAEAVTRKVESDPALPTRSGQSPLAADERLATDAVRAGETPAYARVPATRADAGGTSPPAKPGLFDVARRWLVGGNTLARVGVLLLFVGVGFLLKYASEHVVVPIELRVAGVALGAVVLLVLGWRLRERRSAYAMILQGAGVGVLYLTVFAALRLYALVPPSAAFALLVAIAALSAVLAIKQNAVALAAIGVVGGFAAPILTSSQSGSHVMLFTWYALLNAAILAIAWFKAWRILNLLGFVCTFLVGTLWGVTRYRPDDFATTEPFLVLFFLFYVAIAVLYALRHSVSVRDYVDGTLVFGTPLVAAGLQASLVTRFEFGMAFSAVAVAVLYVALARMLWSRHREDLRLLTESFVALGVVFATLAVPLAFDATWTSATWALEGAAIVWVGLRQERPFARAFGLLLQVAAGGAFAVGAGIVVTRSAEVLPILNSTFLGAWLVAMGGLATALAYSRTDATRPRERFAVMPLFFAWGMAWWVGAGAHETDAFVADVHKVAVFVMFLVGSAVVFAFAARALAWPLARMPAMVLGLALLATAIVASFAPIDGHLFAHAGALAWLAAIAAMAFLLHRFERGGVLVPLSRAADGVHAVAFWLVTYVAAHEVAWNAATYADGRGWPGAAYGFVPALAVALACWRARAHAWPFGVHRNAYVGAGAVPFVAWMIGWSVVVGVTSDASPAPLAYVPLLNPVDLALAFVAVALVLWLRTLRAVVPALAARLSPDVVAGLAAVLGFLWLNAIALRMLHHWYGIDWSAHALWNATLVQVVLSLLWTAIALAAMVVANRVRARVGWIGGAALLTIVVAKLFVVDLSRVGSIERIVSFIGVGVLLLAIGYFAPVPARRVEAS